jgi:hypothetical protein
MYDKIDKAVIGGRGRLQCLRPSGGDHPAIGVDDADQDVRRVVQIVAVETDRRKDHQVPERVGETSGAYVLQNTR